MAQVAIERARVRPGRHVWFARIPFVLAAAIGGAAIVGMKFSGFDQIEVTLVACALIVAYAIIVFSVPILRVREDQLADNCYYLGFLYTLISLAWALYEFSKTPVIEAIIGNFGIALFSTITGIVLRVFINQARRDVLETERDARIELAQAVVHLRTQIDDAVLALSSFGRIVQQTTEEHIQAVGKEALGVLKDSVSEVGRTAAQALKRLEKAATDFGNQADKMNDNAAGAAESIATLVSRIDGIEAPRDLLVKRIEPIFEGIDRISVRITEKLERDESTLREYIDQALDLRRQLAAATDQLKEAATALGAALEKERQLASELGVGLDQLRSGIQLHNEQLAKEVERAHGLIGQTSDALVKLADYVTEAVGSRS